MSHGFDGSSMLRCPFCEGPIEEPIDAQGPFGSKILGGRCGCGAVYVFDRSGHNLGDAYVDALTLAFDGDLETAWRMTPDEDYEVRELALDRRRGTLRGGPGGRGRLSPMYVFILRRTR